MIQNGPVMEMKERLAKTQARARAYTNIVLDDFYEAEGYQQQTLQQQKDQKQFTSKKRQTLEIGSARVTEKVVYATM